MTSKEKAPRNRTLTLTPKEAEALRGDILSIDEASRRNFIDTLICDDAIKALEAIPDGFAQLIVVDPPYNLSKQFASTRFHATSDADYEAYLRTWLPLLCRKLSDNGTLYLCGDWRCSSAMQRILAESLTIINRITWQREKGRGSTKNWKNSMEDIWMAVKNPAKYTFNADAVKLRRRVIAPYRLNGEARDWQQEEDGRYRLTFHSNFWDDITVPFWSMPENTEHPTQKPEKLIAKLILASSNEGDIILDPFGGSGTTAVVARKLRRRYCTIEREHRYTLLAAKRLRLALTHPHIQGYDNGIFLSRNTPQ